MFEYYLGLKEMECKHDYNNYLVVSTFKEDKELVSRGSMQRKLSSLLQKLNITSLNMILIQPLKINYKGTIKTRYCEQLKNIYKSDSGKLAFYSKIVKQNEYRLLNII